MSRGFTLIELLVVVVIILLVAGLILAGSLLIQRSAWVLITTQRIEQITSNLGQLSVSEGGPAMNLLYGREIRPGMFLGDRCDVAAPYKFRLWSPWGQPDLFNRTGSDLPNEGATATVQRVRCWIDPATGPAAGQEPVEFCVDFSAELSVLACLAAQTSSYQNDRSNSRPWNDHWGNPLAIGMLVYEPRGAPDGADFKSYLALPAQAKLRQSLTRSPTKTYDVAVNPVQNERLWALSRDRLGYNRLIYLMVGASCTVRPAIAGDPRSVWNAVCKRFRDAGRLWDDQAQIKPLWKGVGDQRQGSDVVLLSAPTVLR